MNAIAAILILILATLLAGPLGFALALGGIVLIGALGGIVGVGKTVFRGIHETEDGYITDGITRMRRRKYRK